jgi:hypothetical protein
MDTNTSNNKFLSLNGLQTLLESLNEKLLKNEISDDNIITDNEIKKLINTMINDSGTETPIENIGDDVITNNEIERLVNTTII